MPVLSSKSALVLTGFPVHQSHIVYDLFVFQANEDADFLYRLQCWIKTEKSADEKIADKTIEVMRHRQDFLQPLTQGVVALIGQEFFWSCWSCG